MSAAVFLAILFSICIVLAFFVALSVRKARGQRKSVEYLAHLLQNVKEYKQDLEVAISPLKQQELRKEWLNDISSSQVCYRRDISRWFDLLEECYGRMRRNGIAVREVVRAETYIIRRVQTAAIRESQRKLADWGELLELLSAEGLEPDIGVQLKALASRFATFMDLVRFTSVNKESAASVEQTLMRQSRDLMSTVSSEFHDNEDMQGVVHAFVATGNELLDDFVLLNQNLEVYLKLRELAEVSGEFLRAIRWPLVLSWFWSRVPLESWRFIHVPRLSEYGHWRGISILVAYEQMKSGVVRIASLLYPGFPAIAERIESTM